MCLHKSIGFYSNTVQRGRCLHALKSSQNEGIMTRVCRLSFFWGGGGGGGGVSGGGGGGGGGGATRAVVEAGMAGTG